MGTREGEWLDLVADLLAAPVTRVPAERVGVLLVDMLGAAGCSYYSHSDAEAIDDGWPWDHFAPFWEEMRAYTLVAPERHPLLRYYAATGDVRAMQVADVPQELVGRASMIDFRECGRRWGGVRAQVALPLRAGPRGGRAFVAQRVDPFTAGEMSQLRRVQRLLVGLDRHVAAYAGWSTRAPVGARDLVDAMGMTPRETSVLDLLATGLTAAAIGRRLGIAERTVQKHLQRVYLKLGVADRLAAVQRAGAIGLVAATRDPGERTARSGN